MCISLFGHVFEIKIVVSVIFAFAFDYGIVTTLISLCVEYVSKNLNAIEVAWRTAEVDALLSSNNRLSLMMFDQNDRNRAGTLLNTETQLLAHDKQVMLCVRSFGLWQVCWSMEEKGLRKRWFDNPRSSCIQYCTTRGFRAKDSGAWLWELSSSGAVAFPENTWSTKKCWVS